MTPSKIGRRRFLQAGSAAIGTAAGPAAWSQTRAPRALPPRGEVLIRGAAILSVDPSVGNLTGDIHVRDGVIVAVAPRLTASPRALVIDASRMIALPGFIDTHWHMWGAVGRNFIDDQRGYAVMRETTGNLYTPDRIFTSVSFGLTEAIHAGVTSVLNFDHNVRSPAHADAEIRAHRDCGVRAIYAYGTRNGVARNEPMDTADLERLFVALGRNADPMLRIGAALRGPRNSDQAVYDREMQTVKRLGVPTTYHGGQSPPSISVADLQRSGYVDANTVFAHSLFATEEDRTIMKATGASLSFSTMGEMRAVGNAQGDPRWQLLEMTADGVNVSFSCDAPTISPLSMFENMRTAWQMGVAWRGDRTESLKSLTHGQVIQMATLNGARAMGLQDVTGSLTPGKRADIILVRMDDLNMAPAGNPETMVVRSAQVENLDTVLIDGRIMKRGGKIVAYDPAPVVRAAEAVAAEMAREVAAAASR